MNPRQGWRHLQLRTREGYPGFPSMVPRMSRECVRLSQAAIPRRSFVALLLCVEQCPSRRRPFDGRLAVDYEWRAETYALLDSVLHQLFYRMLANYEHALRERNRFCFTSLPSYWSKITLPSWIMNPIGIPPMPVHPCRGTCRR